MPMFSVQHMSLFPFFLYPIHARTDERTDGRTDAHNAMTIARCPWASGAKNEIVVCKLLLFGRV